MKTSKKATSILAGFLLVILPLMDAAGETNSTLGSEGFRGKDSDCQPSWSQPACS